MSRASRPVRIVLVLASLAVLPAQSWAEARAYASHGSAHFVSPTDFVGEGEATHLGRYAEAGSVSFAPTGNPDVLHVDGSITYTAANGDQLAAIVSGELNTATGAISATVQFAGGTGRFSDAGGSAELTAQLQPNGTISAALSGTIDY